MSQTDLVIFGAGGLAREVAWAVTMPGAELYWPGGMHTDINLVGHLDDRAEAHGTLVNDRPILGGSEWLSDRPGHAVLVAVGAVSARMQIVERLREQDAAFPSYLSPDIELGDHGSIGKGVIALPGVVITVNVQIGSFVLLNPHVSISHDCQIDDYCSLGPGVSLAGNVHLGGGCDIGTNASVIPGVHIGRDVVLGAAACVVRDIPAMATAVGVPARIISEWIAK